MFGHIEPYPAYKGRHIGHVADDKFIITKVLYFVFGYLPLIRGRICAVRTTEIRHIGPIVSLPVDL